MPARKTDDETDQVDKMVRDLSQAIDNDRQKLTKVLDKLVTYADGHEGVEAIAVAESVAKLADSLTKQNHLKVEALKILAKKRSSSEGERDEDPFDDIGGAFEFDRREN